MNNNDEQTEIAEINKLYQELQELTTGALDRVIRLGKLLSVAKNRLLHECDEQLTLFAGTSRDRANTSSREEPSAEQIKAKEWLAIRKNAGHKIDPETAEVAWCYQYTLDPYGIDPDLPEEYRQVGREYFARSPGSDTWVWFGDLPAATAEALWEKHKTSLAFPAGIPLPPNEPDLSAVSWADDGKCVVQLSESTRQEAIEGAKQMAKLAEQISGDYFREPDAASKG